MNKFYLDKGLCHSITFERIGVIIEISLKQEHSVSDGEEDYNQDFTSYFNLNHEQALELGRFLIDMGRKIKEEQS